MAGTLNENAFANPGAIAQPCMPGGFLLGIGRVDVISIRYLEGILKLLPILVGRKTSPASDNSEALSLSGCRDNHAVQFTHESKFLRVVGTAANQTEYDVVVLISLILIHGRDSNHFQLQRT